MDTDQATGVDAMDALVDALDETAEEATVEDGEADPLAEASDDSEQEPELIDLDGKRLEIPPGTPPALVEAVKKMSADLKADYTRKTQGAAEAARSVQMKEANLQQQEQLLSANAQRMAQLTNAQERLSQYEQIDWQNLIDADPVRAQKLQVSYQQERRAVETLHAEWQQGEAQRQQALSAYRAHKLAEGEQQLQKAIPKWDTAKKQQVMKNTLSYGYAPEELQSIDDPRLVMVLHDAAQWKALQAQKKTAMQKVTDAPRVVKPSASTPKPAQNKSAFDRLRKSGRVEDLASLL